MISFKPGHGNAPASNIRKSANKQQRHPYEPCYLYESGIQPLEKFPIRGIIWYQGESNAHNVEAHEKLFHLLTKNWRENWAEELPFYYVQLSSIDRPSWPGSGTASDGCFNRSPTAAWRSAAITAIP